jgi:hypothetical protein
MSYTVTMEGFEGQNMEVSTSFWTAPKLLVNGQPASKGKKRGEMILQRNDGTQITAKWKPQILGLDVPQLVADGKTVKLVEPLKWYQLIWGGWPILLLFLDGFLGALTGCIGFVINTRIFRAEMNGGLKYMLTALVSVLTVIAYFRLALVFAAVAQR